MYDKEELIQIFDKMKANGWQENKPIKWIYYFFGTKRGNVFFAGEEMLGYKFKVSEIKEDSEEAGVFWLTAEKEEQLDLEKLTDKLSQLTELADDHKIFFDHVESEFI